MRQLVAGALAAAILLVGSCHSAPRAIRLATTTSVDSSGLLDDLLPAFTRETGIAVDSVAVGSGKALQLARRGDADLTLTHDPHIEAAFLKEERASLYRKIMFNHFMIVGPPADPANAHGAVTATDAMRRIAQSGALFVSRGDGSGTEAREKLLWEWAGAAPEKDRRLEVGQGMAPTLRVASERAAYCLTDRATLTQLKHALALGLLFEGGPELLNTYAVMVVRQADKTVEAKAARLADWLTDGEGRRRIVVFRVKGAEVFTAWPAGASRDSPDDLPRQSP